MNRGKYMERCKKSVTISVVERKLDTHSFVHLKSRYLMYSRSGTFPSAKEKLSTTARHYRKQGKNTSESIKYYWLSERREMPAQNCHQLFPKNA